MFEFTLAKEVMPDVIDWSLLHQPASDKLFKYTSVPVQSFT